MEIVVNGERRSVPADASVLDLLTSLDLDPSRLAVELNREILKQDRWSETLLAGEEQLEVVQFVGGG
ncbi:MAG: sulfur carrier protein ThiS [bacterium]|nr:sulfur carrier protein ThiS [bacterium]